MPYKKIRHFQHEPATDGERFVQVRQGLVVQGNFSDLTIEHSRLEGDEPLTGVRAIPFFMDRYQVLDVITGRWANKLHG